MKLFSNKQKFLITNLYHYTISPPLKTSIVIIHPSKCNFLSKFTSMHAPFITIPDISPSFPSKTPTNHSPLTPKQRRQKWTSSSILSTAAFSLYLYFLPILPLQCQNTPSLKSQPPLINKQPTLPKRSKTLRLTGNHTMARLQNL